MGLACVDGLKGFPAAIEAVSSPNQVQLCIMHLVRASLNYVPWEQRKEVAADLRAVYQAAMMADTERVLGHLMANWDASFPSVSQIWRRNWNRAGASELGWDRRDWCAAGA